MYDPLKTERLDDGSRRLLSDLHVSIDGEFFTVPKGFETDYSSYPWFTRWVVRWSQVDIAGVLHDYLYSTGQVTRREADRLWRLVAQDGTHSANAFQAWVSWGGLRVGGWVRWPHE